MFPKRLIKKNTGTPCKAMKKQAKHSARAEASELKQLFCENENLPGQRRIEKASSYGCVA